MLSDYWYSLNAWTRMHWPKLISLWSSLTLTHSTKMIFCCWNWVVIISLPSMDNLTLSITSVSVSPTSTQSECVCVCAYYYYYYENTNNYDHCTDGHVCIASATFLYRKWAPSISSLSLLSSLVLPLPPFLSSLSLFPSLCLPLSSIKGLHQAKLL